MSWNNEMVIILRHMIDDLDKDAYQFSNDRLEECIVASAFITKNDVGFDIDYTIDVDNRLISPDPTVPAKDYDFISLCCLQSAMMVMRGQIRYYSMRSYSIRDGQTSVDMRGVVQGIQKMFDDFSKKYDEVKLDYQTSRAGLGQAVLTPYRVWTNEYCADPRNGYFL